MGTPEGDLDGVAADPDEWNGDLETPRRDVAALIRALSLAGNKVRLLANGDEARASANAALGDAAEVIPAKYGDIWLRDTGPIFAHTGNSTIALRFKTNSWPQIRSSRRRNGGRRRCAPRQNRRAPFRFRP